MLDVERTVREYSNMIGAPAVIFHSGDEYNEAVQQERQQAAMAQGVATGGEVANGLKALGDTDMANVQELLAGNMGGVIL